MNGIILNLSVAIPSYAPGDQLLPHARPEETSILMNLLSTHSAKLATLETTILCLNMGFRNKMLLIT